jgi:hypothetical protein
MCHALDPKSGRQKEKDHILYTVVGNFVLYCKCCGFSCALLVFFYIYGFIYLQTIGLRCPINDESKPSS